MYQLYYSIIDFMQYLLLIPIFIGAFTFRRLNLPLKLIFYYVIFNTIITIVTRILAAYSTNNLMFINFFNIVEIFLITYVFSLIINNKKVKLIIRISYIFFLLIIVYTFFFYQNINEYAYHLKLFESFFFIYFGATYLFNAIKKEKDIINDSFALFSIAVLMYFITTFLVFGSFKYLAKMEPSLGIKVWTFNSFFNQIFFFIIEMAFYKQAK